MPNDYQRRFWISDFDPADHTKDLEAMMSEERPRISCIVDEERGGIVAYVLEGEGTSHGETVMRALEAAAAE